MQPILRVGAHVRTYKGVQSIAATASSQLLTVPSGATHCDIYAEGGSSSDFVRYWHGSTSPTASAGKKLKDHEEIASSSPANFRFIASSGSVTLRVEYYSYE